LETPLGRCDISLGVNTGSMWHIIERSQADIQTIKSEYVFCSTQLQ